MVALFFSFSQYSIAVNSLGSVGSVSALLFPSSVVVGK